MAIQNIEIKARTSNQDAIRQLLIEHHAEAKGTDHQVDTYFRVANGRLKLREGNIENNLIHYRRENQEGPKLSDITLYPCKPDSPLKELLTKALGVLTVVEKKREIYFIDNVKFHLDTVATLGGFVEIEAIDDDGSIGRDQLRKQCEYFMSLFGIAKEDLISSSYSDMLLKMRIV